MLIIAGNRLCIPTDDVNSLEQQNGKIEMCHDLKVARRGGRVVYGSGLENQRVFTGTVGSNPTLSVLKSQSLA